MATSTGKRLAKNSAFMYFRMIILLLISFYTSRVILEKLGVEDFGTYNLVGSIVAMFSSLRTLFSSSTRRFLSYEIGRNSTDRLQTVFNSSIYINLFIAVIFVVIVEIVGMWFLYNKINIDPTRLTAAIWVFQFSVVTAVLSIIVTSYDAVIITHEKMNFYAYMSIFEGVMKLLVVFLLPLLAVDKLILYGLLLLLVSFFILIINFTYCLRHYPETRLKLCWDKELLKQMSTFAGWNFLGKTSYALSQNGLNMVLNVFGGSVVNAARGIAMQLNSATNQFLNNIDIAVYPYCIKTFASGNISKFYALTYMSSKIYFLVEICLSIPIILLTENILQLWLGVVPEYSVIFLQLIMMWSVVRSVHGPIDTIFSSANKMKFYQIAESIILLIPIAVGYVSLMYGGSYWTVFALMIVTEFINYVAILFLAKKQLNLSLIEYSKNVFLPCTFASLPLIVSFISQCFFTLPIGIKIAECAFVMGLSICILYFIGFSKTEKGYILDLIKSKRK